MTDPDRRTIRVVAALLERGGRYLITQRRPAAVLPLRWEFPGGRVEEGEGDEGALIREFAERLGTEVTVRVRELISYVAHPYQHYDVELYLYACDFESQAPIETALQPVAVHDVRWVSSDEFDDYDFTPADEASMSALLGEPTDA